MKRIFLFLAFVLALVGCSDNESFTTDTQARLTFSVDTVKMDTVFSSVGSSTYSFWIFNHYSQNIRLKSVRLRSGNQTGFRVNVDGSYLDNALGSVAGNLEVRSGDSIRVFVELTAPENGQPEAMLVQDDLLFSLESGTEQSVCLRGYAWDAIWLHDVVVGKDSVIDANNNTTTATAKQPVNLKANVARKKSSKPKKPKTPKKAEPEPEFRWH